MGQLSALFYKNWILYKRGLFGNFLELAIPLFFVFFVVVVRRLELPTTYEEQSFYSNPLYSYNVQSNSIPTAFLKYYVLYIENVLRAL